VILLFGLFCWESGLGAIQIICDTLGGRGGGVSKNVTRKLLLVISQVRFDKNVTWERGGLKSAEKVSHII
jgi:hypothetical protein